MKIKIGPRKPSLKKRISARTSIKRQVVHRAGLKMPRGYGWVRDPKKVDFCLTLSIKRTLFSDLYLLT